MGRKVIRPVNNKTVREVVDGFQKLRSDRESRVREFAEGRRSFLVYQTPGGDVWGDVRTPEESFSANIGFIHKSLDVKSDHIPVMEPWFGTGIYANIFGCKYLWKDNTAPHVHYRYEKLDEIKGMAAPEWEDSEMANLVLDAIRYFKSRTGDDLPVIWTDTQSASDTATLILNPTEVLVGCMMEPGAVMEYFKLVNDMIIKFSRVQSELIGDALLEPGHIMLSSSHLRGMSISDDNLALGSPEVNRDFNMPMNDEIGRAMNGVAIHSCGVWAHSMHLVKEHCPSCVAIDCAVDNSADPNPNDPEKVRDAMAGTGITVHVRFTGETGKMAEVVRKLKHPGVRYVFHPSYVDIETAEKNYDVITGIMKP